MRNRIRNQQQYWNRMAEGYSDRYHLRSRNAQRKIARKVGILWTGTEIKNSDAVLELGCGTGVFTQGLARTGTEITAVDLSLTMLEVAMKHPTVANITFQWDDAHQLTFPNDSFDVVVGCYILQYLDLKKAIPEIKRVLKPGGRLAFIDINKLNPVAFAKTNIPLVKKLMGISKEAVSFTRQELRNWFARYGFTDIEVKAFEFGTSPLNILERVPIIRQFAGNLLITAKNNLK